MSTQKIPRFLSVTFCILQSSEVHLLWPDICMRLLTLADSYISSPSLPIATNFKKQSTHLQLHLQHLTSTLMQRDLHKCFVVSIKNKSHLLHKCISLRISLSLNPVGKVLIWEYVEYMNETSLFCNLVCVSHSSNYSLKIFLELANQLYASHLDPLLIQEPLLLISI